MTCEFNGHEWLIQCQYNVTGWGIMSICGAVLLLAGKLNPA